MNSLCNTITLKPSSIFFHKSKPHFVDHPIEIKSNVSITLRPLSSNLNPRQCRIRACSAAAADHHPSSSDIDMVRTKEGVYAAKPKKVVVLWDLDNKPPRGPPYQAAMALRQVAQKFGEVVNVSAYANRHAFVHLPQWVLEERRQRRTLDVLERKGVAAPPEPYVCSVCGRKCKTNLDLKKHFRQLHERERQKKLNRMRSLKGKKRQRFKERFVDGNHKYEEAARSLITPKVGYGLAAELRRAGVFVKTVEDKPQAADWALKRQMQHTMSRGIDWLFLVSDDSDFSDMLRRARESNLGTVVVGDMDRALGRHADLWVPWSGIENGEVSEDDLVARSRGRSEVMDGNHGELSSTNGGLDLESLMDELVGVRTDFTKISEFREGDEEVWAEGEMNQEGGKYDGFRIRHSLDDDDDDDYGDEDFLSDSDDE